MAHIRDCDTPDDLSYDVANNIWARLEDGGEVVVGMTAYGCSLAGRILAFTPRKVGREVRQFKSCATVESGKWVGSVRAPVTGEIVAVNDAVLNDPELINRDPYGAGWLLKLRPEDWDRDSPALARGERALREFEAKMDADGFDGC